MPPTPSALRCSGEFLHRGVDSDWGCVLSGCGQLCGECAIRRTGRTVLQSPLDVCTRKAGGNPGPRSYAAPDMTISRTTNILCYWDESLQAVVSHAMLHCYIAALCCCVLQGGWPPCWCACTGVCCTQRHALWQHHWSHPGP
jgi:hypothetical protein